MATPAIYQLAVPFAERNQAKQAGARWHPVGKFWFVANADDPALRRWPALTELPGEDRSFGGKQLYVDLIPQNCWFSNARTCIDPTDWTRVRDLVRRRADFKCEVCGSASQNEAHERWSYDETAQVQSLRRLICLCSQCHAVTHFGLAELRGKSLEALTHLMRVRDESIDKAREHIDEAFALWQERNQIAWRLDLSILWKANIGVVAAPGASRSEIACRDEVELEDDGQMEAITCDSLTL